MEGFKLTDTERCCLFSVARYSVDGCYNSTRMTELIGSERSKAMFVMRQDTIELAQAHADARWPAEEPRLVISFRKRWGRRSIPRQDLLRSKWLR